MNTLLLKEKNKNTISIATSLLAKGQLVAIPTETVYGLAADASNKKAITEIFKVKNRPTNHPLIMHFSDVNTIFDYVINVPDYFFDLANEFWPGPLTVLLHKSERVLTEITGGSNKVCVRIPNHPLTLSIIRGLGSPIVAPSANNFGHISPTAAEHVMSDMHGKIAAVVDGGNCDVGIESTILDLTTEEPTVLRPGGCDLSALEAKLGRKVFINNSNKAKISGNLINHYQPRTPLIRLTYSEIIKFCEGKRFVSNSILMHYSPLNHLSIRSYLMPESPKSYGQDLYAVLRALDNSNYEAIYIEAPPSETSWMAIQDRVFKAAYK